MTDSCPLYRTDLCGIVAGDININAGSDGIKSTYDTDTTKGNVIIEGGNITIKASNDGIQAENILVINDGTIQEDETPEELFDHPKNARLQEFLSKIL